MGNKGALPRNDTKPTYISESRTDPIPAERLNVPALNHRVHRAGKRARIVIVGGGPSGIHMASRLKRRGYKNVVVLEKEAEGSFGKTFTLFHKDTADTPHEMGTCYLSWSYQNVRQLIEEYLGDKALITPGAKTYHGLSMVSPELDQKRNLNKETHSSDTWLYAHASSVKLSKAWWWLPNKIQAINFVVDIRKYRKLHESIFGVYDYHGLPPVPSTEKLQEIDCSFADLMTRNGLKPLLDLCAVGFGSYGFGFDVPALYGLWFVTPLAVESYVASKINSKIKTVELLKHGYGALWRAIVAKDKIEVRYKTKVVRIDRHLKDRRRPVEVHTETPDGTRLYEADLLIFAAPMSSAFMPVVTDATPLEREICQSLKTKGLVVSLFRTQKKQTKATKNGERSLTFYPESLMPEYCPNENKECQRVYAERNSVRAFRPHWEEKHRKRYSVAYTLLPKYNPDASETISKAKRFMTSKTRSVEPTAKRGIDLLAFKNWDYFPHFTKDAVRSLLPWRIMENQGTARTWYIGSSVCFESVEDVTCYNDQLLEHKFRTNTRVSAFLRTMTTYFNNMTEPQGTTHTFERQTTRRGELRKMREQKLSRQLTQDSANQTDANAPVRYHGPSILQHSPIQLLRDAPTQRSSRHSLLRRSHRDGSTKRVSLTVPKPARRLTQGRASPKGTARVVCAGCGHRMEATANFCSKCGQKSASDAKDQAGHTQDGAQQESLTEDGAKDQMVQWRSRGQLESLPESVPARAGERSSHCDDEKAADMDEEKAGAKKRQSMITVTIEETEKPKQLEKSRTGFEGQGKSLRFVGSPACAPDLPPQTFLFNDTARSDYTPFALTPEPGMMVAQASSVSLMSPEVEDAQTSL